LPGAHIFAAPGNTFLTRKSERGRKLRKGKVEICGVNTATLKTLTEAEKQSLLRRVREEGSPEAREALVIGNLRLVLSVIGRFSSKKEQIDDLFQVGCVGLLKAIDNFNTELNVRFSTYAVPMILGEVRRYLRDNNALRVSRGLRDLAYRALQVREEVCHKEGRDPTTAEIAQMLGEEEKSIARAMEAIAQPMSLYDSVYNDGEDSVYVIDQLGDEEEGDASFVESISLKEALAKLSEREMGIISLRFYKGRTQMEIAAEIGISQAQVSRLEKGAIEKLRKHMV
jgi:RNA polymerase sporulation-specific sigma factor